METHRLKLEITARKDRPSFTATLWRSSAVAFEVGLFEEGAALDLTGVNSITMRVRKARLAEPVLLEKTVAAAAFTSSTPAQWAAGTHQHLSLEMTSDEMGLTLGSKVAVMFVSFSALLASGSVQVLGAGEFIFHDANAVAGEVSEGSGTAISLAEADLRFLRHDGAQDLTEAQQLRALLNAGITVSATGITLPNGRAIFFTDAP